LKHLWSQDTTLDLNDSEAVSFRNVETKAVTPNKPQAEELEHGQHDATLAAARAKLEALSESCTMTSTGYCRPADWVQLDSIHKVKDSMLQRDNEDRDNIDTMSGGANRGTSSTRRRFAHKAAPPEPLSQRQLDSPRKEMSTQVMSPALWSSPKMLRSPTRPEDVDEMFNLDPQSRSLGSLAALEKARKHVYTERLNEEVASYATMPLQGVGPVGAIPTITRQAFRAGTYFPSQSDGGDCQPQCGESEVQEAPHEQVMPGQLPWHTFRSGIMLLLILWALGTVWAISVACGVVDIDDKMLPTTLETSNRLTPKKKSFTPNFHMIALPKLLGGAQVPLKWPHTSFQPLSMSWDSSGHHLVISDDFQLYSASLNLEPKGRKLDGLHGARLHLAPSCSALEGQAIRDVGLVCGAYTKNLKPVCKGLVLHQRGQLLAVCDVDFASGGRATMSSKSSTTLVRASTSVDYPNSSGVDNVGTSDRVWHISDEWLHSSFGTIEQEEVHSMAVYHQCKQAKEFSPNKTYPCVVVGTTHGRVVRLRRHLVRDNELVPAGALRDVVAARAEDTEKLASGSLHVFHSGYLLTLHRTRNTVQAIDVRNGRLVGEWTLPQQPLRTWTALSGGGNFLYIISQDNDGGNAELWRFPAPKANGTQIKEEAL